MASPCLTILYIYILLLSRKPRPVRVDDLLMEDGAFPQQTGSRREYISSEGLANGWDDFQEHPNCSRLSWFDMFWIKNDWSFDDWAPSHGMSWVPTPCPLVNHHCPPSKWPSAVNPPSDRPAISSTDRRSRNLKRPSSCSCVSSLCVLSSEGKAAEWYDRGVSSR